MLSRDRINALAAQAAALLDVPAEVVANAPGGHDTHYVEVILTVVGSEDTPCRVVVRLDRDQSDSEIRAAATAGLLEYPNLHLAREDCIGESPIPYGTICG
jgi:hypothetical protein